GHWACRSAALARQGAILLRPVQSLSAQLAFLHRRSGRRHRRGDRHRAVLRRRRRTVLLLRPALLLRPGLLLPGTASSETTSLQAIIAARSNPSQTVEMAGVPNP